MLLFTVVTQGFPPTVSPSFPDEDKCPFGKRKQENFNLNGKRKLSYASPYSERANIIGEAVKSPAKVAAEPRE
jgi:hypothetical protein